MLVAGSAACSLVCVGCVVVVGARCVECGRCGLGWRRARRHGQRRSGERQLVRGLAGRHPEAAVKEVGPVLGLVRTPFSRLNNQSSATWWTDAGSLVLGHLRRLRDRCTDHADRVDSRPSDGRRPTSRSVLPRSSSREVDRPSGSRDRDESGHIGRESRDLAMDRSRRLARLPGHRFCRTRERDRLRSAHFGDLEHGRRRFGHLRRTGSAVPARSARAAPRRRTARTATRSRRQVNPPPTGIPTTGLFVVTATISWSVSWSAQGAAGGGALPSLSTSSSAVPSCRAGRESRHVADDSGSFAIARQPTGPLEGARRREHVAVGMTSLLDRRRAQGGGAGIGGSRSAPPDATSQQEAASGSCVRGRDRHEHRRVHEPLLLGSTSAAGRRRDPDDRTGADLQLDRSRSGECERVRRRRSDPCFAYGDRCPGSVPR